MQYRSCEVFYSFRDRAEVDVVLIPIFKIRLDYRVV